MKFTLVNMTVSRQYVLKLAKYLLFFAIAASIMTYFTCTTCRSSLERYAVVSSISMLGWIVLWGGNDLLAEYLSGKISWLKFPVKRLIVGLITTVVYTIAAVVALMISVEFIFNITFSGFTWTIYFSVVITIVISLILHSREFLISWRQASIDAEKLQKENMSAKYESLKNQVNPHFLFNSFNALTNLVYEDQDKAAKFIKQLSEVYRYVLDTRDREVVSLEEEMKFLSSYLYLQQIRFGEKLKVDVSINGKQSMVAPLALQMLIENAIKHNVVSEEIPLNIRLYADEHWIVVENNLQRKSKLSEDSAGLGLENIRKRYEFLSDTKVLVEEDNSKFTVKLPVIHD
jgi:sensor histidine kinase YesM